MTTSTSFSSSYSAPTLSTPGVGSGLDVNSIVSKLVSLEKQPLTALQSRASTINSKVSTFGQIQSLMSNLSSAASTLGNISGWSGVTAASSSPTAVGVTANPGTLAGTFSVAVQNLAQKQSSASGPMLPVGGAIGAGSIQLQLGTWTSNGSTFTAGATSATSISVSSTDTVTDIASKINSANAGVSATVLTDASGQRLLLQSQNTGAAAGFKVSVTDSDGNNTDNAGLSRLVYGLSTTQQAQDAAATINGVAVTSASNTMSSTIPGVTLTLSQTTTTPATITIAQDTAKITQEVNAFATAYNTINDALTQATKYDAATSKAGILQGDAVANQLQFALRHILQSSTTGGTFTQLSDIGVTTLLGGDLQVDSTKLTAALQQSTSDVQHFFNAGTGTGLTDGLAKKITNFATGALSATGLFTQETNSFQSQLDANTKEQQAVNDRAARVQVLLTKQYSALDGQMASLNALSAYVQQQVTTWNKSTTNGG